MTSVKATMVDPACLFMPLHSLCCQVLRALLVFSKKKGKEKVASFRKVFPFFSSREIKGRFM